MSLPSDTDDEVIDVQAPVAVPRLDGVTAGWLLCLVWAVFFSSPTADTLIGGLGGQVWQGVMWGTASVMTWMLASPPATLRRRLLAVLVLTTLFWWFAFISGQPIVRYVISLGSFVLLQLAVTSILGWPGWSAGSQSLQAEYRYRFSIGGLLALTGAIAILLAATRIYEAPEELFLGSRIAAVGMVAIALCGQRALISRRRGALWAVAMLLGIAMTDAMLGTLNTLQTSGLSIHQAFSRWHLFNAPDWLYYLTPLLAFASVVAGTALCGRLDHEMVRAERRTRAALEERSDPQESV